MAKKIIFFLFVFFFLFFFNSINIKAQDLNSENNSFLSISNLEFDFNCGFANTEYNKCCSSFKETIEKNQEKLLAWSSFDNIFNNFINNIKEFFIKKISDISIFNLYLLGDRCKTGKEKIINGECFCIDDQYNINNISKKRFERYCEIYFKNNDIHLKKCLNCILQDKYYSAIGCIPFNLDQFINEFLLNRLIGLAGIFAFFCIIYASFMMQSSQGNQEKLKKAQELLTSCIMGLIFIIFSVFILKLIGVDILKLPGLK